MDSFQLNIGPVRYEGKGVLVNQVDTNYLGTKDAPIVVHVDTDTDWPSIIPSGAGVIVALIVAWLTVRVQKTQISANISTFRHQWINELRVCAAEYMQAMFSMSINLCVEEDYRGKPDYSVSYAKMIMLGTKFEFLISRDDDDTARMRDLDNEIIALIGRVEYSNDLSPVFGKINKFKELVRDELESAWADIQRDLGKNKRSSFRSFFSLNKS